MDTTQKRLLQYFEKLSDKKQLDIVDFVEYLYEKEIKESTSAKAKTNRRVLEKSIH